MNNWLAYTVSLTETRDLTTLTRRYIDTLREALPISAAWVIAADAQGRQLRIIGDDQSPQWAVDDFSHPFAHVLRSAKAMLLDKQRLIYWQENKHFATLMALRKQADGVLIAPLPSAAPRKQALLVMTATASTLNGLDQEVCWQLFSDCYINHWRIIADIDKHTSQQSALKASISSIHQREHQRNLSLQLQTRLIGGSATMQALRKQVVNAAQSDLSVLIRGETGTGKELVARAVHDLSPRKDNPFIAINCAAIPENLLESELFGYVKGAFSGADRHHKGLLAEADGGTLFLDEIGDMPLALQAKLLRVLESHAFRPVGGKQEESADFRLVTATHVALREQVRNQAFRQDLYYRLNQFPVNVPALQQRMGDLQELVQYFIAAYNQRGHAQISGIRHDAIELLSQYRFPGNVRELRNLIEYACSLTADGQQISANCFAGRSLDTTMDLSQLPADEHPDDHLNGLDIQAITDLKQALHHFESQIIRSRLACFNGNRAKAAASLGIPKRTLAHKCLKLEIESP